MNRKAVFPALLPFLLLCSNPANQNTPLPSPQIGPAVTYVAGVAATEITDTTTGFTFRLDTGSVCSLAVAPIITPPNPAPFSGTGFYVSMKQSAGQDRALFLKVKKPAGGRKLLWGFGLFNMHTDDGAAGADSGWTSILPQDSTTDSLLFPLFVPLSLSGLAKRISFHDGYTHYWLAEIKPGTSDYDKMNYIEAETDKMMLRLIDSLPSPLRDTVLLRCNTTHKVAFTFGSSNYYSGFLFRTWAGIHIMSPTLSFTTGADAERIAHETGHYLNHVMVGDAVFHVLQGQDPGALHGIGDPHPDRATLLEEPAYLSEYFQNGNITKVCDPTNPKGMFSNSTIAPTVEDRPGLEGFGSVLLAALFRKSDSIPNVYPLPAGSKSYMIDIPRIGASFGDLFTILSQGVTTVEELYSHVWNYLDSKGKAAQMPVIMQRIGWSYSVKGRLVDLTKKGYGKANITNILTAGVRRWTGGKTPTATDTTGAFAFDQVFPDSSTFLVTRGKDTTRIGVRINHQLPTNTVVDLGDLITSRDTATATVPVAPFGIYNILSKCGLGVCSLSTTGSITGNGAVLSNPPWCTTGCEYTYVNVYGAPPCSVELRHRWWSDYPYTSFVNGDSVWEWQCAGFTPKEFKRTWISNFRIYKSDAGQVVPVAYSPDGTFKLLVRSDTVETDYYLQVLLSIEYYTQDLNGAYQRTDAYADTLYMREYRFFYR